MLAFDADLRCTGANDPARGRFDDPTGATATDLLDEGVAADLTAALEDGEPRTLTVRDGTGRYRCRAYPDEDGVSLYCFERADPVGELDDTGRKLRALVENTDSAVYVKDRDGEYELLNDAAADLFDIDPESGLGTDDYDLFDEESARDIVEDDRRIMEAGEKRTFQSERRIDGERVVFLNTKFPYYDEDGEVAGVMGTSRNITDRERRERELERSRDVLARTERLGDTGGWEYDLEEEVVRWTDGAARIHGARGEFEGDGDRADVGFEADPETVLDLYHPDDRERIDEAVRECLDGDEEFDVEYRALVDGETRWLRAIGQPVSENGDVVQIRGAIRDVTERKRRELELERQNERLDEFATVVSHDLRTPMNVARLHAEDLAGEGDERASEILTSLDRMEEIVEDTLTLARQGRTVSDPEPVDLDELVAACWDRIAVDADATLVREDLPAVRGDPARLRNLFENLLGNAVEHGSTSSRPTADDEGGSASVTVRVGRDGPTTLFVADDGPGIPPDHRDEAFDAGWTTAEEGTGFGLSIVKRIAEAHGWSASVTESEAGGARFEFEDVDVVTE